MSSKLSKYTSCLERLLELKAASRLASGDGSLYGSGPEAQRRAEERLGWLHLAAQPPLAPDLIMQWAAEIRAEGLDAVVLIGQGGSSQASMTVTKLREVASSKGSDVAFRTMDSLSPVFVHHILGASDPAHTFYIVSSKSGSTIEPRMHERVAWHYVAGHLGEAKAAERFAAITDLPSELSQLAAERGYRLTLPGTKSVGGRFSALTVFTLFPAALAGINIVSALEESAQTEALCACDSPENPAIQLAAFLSASYLAGRDKFSLVMPPSGQVFGLWVEQMIAESLGKLGKGIIPNVEVDASILSQPRPDRSVITFAVGQANGFAESIANIDPSLPTLHFTLDSPEQAFSHFVVWEYATALLGILLDVFPFDQPDVELTKSIVRDLLANEGKLPPKPVLPPAPQLPPTSQSAARPGAAEPASAFSDGFASSYLRLAVTDPLVGDLCLSQALGSAAQIRPADMNSLDALLRGLLSSIGPGDYFSLNAFVPFRGYGRREALERMRNRVAARLGVVSCLEIGPRYLHSTGQLHKGGPDTGVFLILSTDELDDLRVPGLPLTLGDLATTQACADFMALAACNRRALYVHLPDNDSETLAHFADRFCSAVSAIRVVKSV
ncbi:MAG: glucose-6-phosphate isomerase [Coriobacteriia bacterium]|nr:glucose-6-phosphate isomerase [Coriobacteriia bacterium]